MMISEQPRIWVHIQIRMHAPLQSDAVVKAKPYFKVRLDFQDGICLSIS